MAEKYATFDYIPSGHPSTLPEWQWGTCLAVRISVDDLMRICRPVGTSPPDLVIAANRPALDRAIMAKLRGVAQRPSEPITLNFGDF